VNGDASDDRPAYEPVSLGDSCATKFQICRKLHDIMFPGRSEASFRLRIITPEFGERFFGKALFDWSGTPVDSVSLSLEVDMKGLFEREDLEFVDGTLMNVRFGSNLIHYFESADLRGLVDEVALERTFPQVKRGYERMCDSFRSHLTQPGPFLYIHRCGEFPEPAQVERLIKALSARSEDHAFHLLFVGEQQYDQDYSPFGEMVSKGYRTKNHNKPKSREWEDNDAEWDLALAPFELRPSAALLVANPPPVSRSAPNPVPNKPKGGLLHRLLGR